MNMVSTPYDVIGRINKDVDDSSQKILNFFVQMLKIRAVNPRGGGGGEHERADFIQEFMKNQGFQVKRVDVNDDENGGVTRSNLSASIEGVDSSRTLWLISHMDTVPEGSLDLWDSDPFEPQVRDGRIIARGSEDNGQSLVASLFALRELTLFDVRLPFNVGVWFVADEEAGSKYGIKHLLAHNYFGKNDIVVVPDSGSPDGKDIEIAEKSLLWLKITTTGKQVHASLPRKGINSTRIGMRYALEIDEFLHKKYDAADPLFNEPLSTFEPTKKETNVANVNTIPGLDVQYFDCRVLPRYSLDDVIENVKSTAEVYKKKYNCNISVGIEQRDDAGPATSEDSEVAKLLAKAIETMSNKRPRYVGIGGQTVGNLFRKAGIPTAVWSTIDEVAHEPNEYCKISNLLNDTKVFAALPLMAMSGTP
ncbi:MAG: M20 family metallo-hydrolase [Nitrososphaerota archaeon]|nr:M20 family metallo-hydrolase [Nitrososphaerota archaeon]